MAVREIERRSGLSRNTIRKYLSTGTEVFLIVGV
jgi:predicted transcriptional regulator